MLSKSDKKHLDNAIHLLNACNNSQLIAAHMQIVRGTRREQKAIDYLESNSIKINIK